MAQSKCPDPATSGSEHSGGRHLSIFSPRTTQCTHSAPRPGHSLPRITRGPDNCLLFLACSQHKQALWYPAPRPIQILAQSARGPDHGLRPSYFLLLPASTAPCPEHFQAKALGGLTGINRAARTHLFSSSHNTQTFSAKSHAFSSHSNIFSNYLIDWIRATIYGA